MTTEAINRLLLGLIIAFALGATIAESKSLKATFAFGLVGCAVANFLISRRGSP